MKDVLHERVGNDAVSRSHFVRAKGRESAGTERLRERLKKADFLIADA